MSELERTETTPPRQPRSRRGVDVLLDFLEDNGYEYVFGNPGTFEQGVMEALSRRHRLSYVLGLHESVAVAMADGYSRASGRPAFVNVHVSAGLANGLSQVYNARAHHSPLLITAGQAQSHMLIEEPLLAADSVSLASHFTKWAWELRHPADLPTALRRSQKVALSPPCGPVFLSLPIDILDMQTIEDRRPLEPHTRTSRPVPDADTVRAAAAMLTASARPVILCGDEVGRAGAVPGLVGLAEILGAQVFAIAQCEVSFPNSHPQFVRTLNPSSAASREHVADADLILAVGTPLLQQLLSPGTPILPQGTPVVHITESEWEAHKNVPADVALVGDLAASLSALQAAATDAMTASDKARAEDRRNAALRTKEARLRRLAERIRASEPGDGIEDLHLMSSLRALMPSSFSIVEEAPTASSALQQSFGFSHPKSLFGNRGAALGWAMPAAVGVQLAMPGRAVVAVVGDGAANYSIQALWTAAHRQLPVKFVICNNRQYQVLKANIADYLPEADPQALVGMDLIHPPIDYCALARGYGVPARRINASSDLMDGLAETMREPGPALVDVVLAGSAGSVRARPGLSG